MIDFIMSIYKDIKKARQIPYTEENALFICQREPGTSGTSRRSRRIHKPKPPKNANLYDNDNDDDDDDDDDNYSQRHYSMPQELHEHEIASSIREANCGIDYSNESLEEHWRARQAKASTSSEDTSLMFIKPTVEVSNEAPISETKTDDSENVVDEENILKQCKLNKNAAIRGLLKNQKISLNDLHVPSASVDTEDARNISVQKENVSPPSNLTEGDFSIKLVQYPEDPEVFVQPLQVYGSIDENKYKDIDFSVPHIGKKRIITPRQFYVEMDDSDFDFVKKDTKRKN